MSSTSSEFELTTSRLVLNELRSDDLDVMHEVLGDPDSMRYYPAAFTRDEAQSWIERNQAAYRERGFGLWAVRLKSNGQLIGDTGLSMQDVDGATELEVGWHIHPDHQRCGYATEAARACVEYAFQRLVAEHVVSLIRPENIPSQRVAEKLGMAVVGTTTRGPGWLHNVWALSAS